MGKSKKQIYDCKGGVYVTDKGDTVVNSEETYYGYHHARKLKDGGFPTPHWLDPNPMWDMTGNFAMPLGMVANSKKAKKRLSAPY